MDQQSPHVITVPRRAQGAHAWAQPGGLLAAAPLEYKKHNHRRVRAPYRSRLSHGNHFSPTVVDAQDTFQRQVARRPAARGGQPGCARPRSPGAAPAAVADNCRQPSAHHLRHGRRQARCQHGAAALTVCIAGIVERRVFWSGAQRFSPQHGLAAPEGSKMIERIESDPPAVRRDLIACISVYKMERR